MELVLTGTGAPLPDPNRAGPSTLVRTDQTQILVDAGRGTVMRLAGAATTPAKLTAVCITHLHSDHICSLGDIIATHWTMSAELNPGATLAIFGPPGTAELVDLTLAFLGPDVGYRIKHHDVLAEGPKVETTELLPAMSFLIGDVRVTTAATVHTPVEPTIGYRFDHDGKSAALVGDTVPCVGIDQLCAGVGAYVQTVVRDDLIEAMPSSMLQDMLDYHSTVVDAAQTATRAKVQRLVLTHMIPSPMPGSYDEWVRIAAAHFAGEIVIGDDLTSIVL